MKLRAAISEVIGGNEIINDVLWVFDHCVKEEWEDDYDDLGK